MQSADEIRMRALQGKLRVLEEEKADIQLSFYIVQEELANVQVQKDLDYNLSQRSFEQNQRKYAGQDRQNIELSEKIRSLNRELNTKEQQIMMSQTEIDSNNEDILELGEKFKDARLKDTDQSDKYDQLANLMLQTRQELQQQQQQINTLNIKVGDMQEFQFANVVAVVYGDFALNLQRKIMVFNHYLLNKNIDFIEAKKFCPDSRHQQIQSSVNFEDNLYGEEIKEITWNLLAKKFNQTTSVFREKICGIIKECKKSRKFSTHVSHEYAQFTKTLDIQQIMLNEKLNQDQKQSFISQFHHQKQKFNPKDPIIFELMKLLSKYKLYVLDEADHLHLYELVVDLVTEYPQIT